MKKILLLIAAFVGFTAGAQLMQGDILINGGVGLGLIGQNYKMKFPPVSLSGEYMMTDNISAGLEGGFFGFTYNYGMNISLPDESGETGISQSATGDYNGIYFMGLGNYHFVNNTNLDVYAGLKLGYVILNGESNITMTTSSDDDSDANSTVNMNLNTGPVSHLGYGAQVGARYMFSDNFGAFAEVGYGISILKLGLTYKIGY